jgi:hypothetical protein
MNQTVVVASLSVCLAVLPLLAQEKPHAAHPPPLLADSMPRIMPERPSAFP